LPGLLAEVVKSVWAKQGGHKFCHFNLTFAEAKINLNF